MANSSPLPSSSQHPYEIHAVSGQDDVPAPPPGVHTLPDLFAYRARQQPSAIALSCEAEGTAGLQKISYGEAHSHALRTATVLRRKFAEHRRAQPTHEVRRQPVIGIWLEKSLDLTLSVLGATFSGAAWLPFDHDAPPARVAVCLSDSGASILLCDAAHEERAREAVESMQGPQSEVLIYQDLEKAAAQEERAGRSLMRAGPQPEDAAYYIYTSGTTGTPKGISIPHRAALTFAMSESSEIVLGLSPRDIVWQGFSPAFDMWIEETWCAFAAGAHVAVGTREQCRDVSGLGGSRGVWAQRGVTVVHAVPTLMGIMTMEGLGDAEDVGIPQNIRLINLGGEACPPALVTRLWRPNLRLLNTWGPSECTVSGSWAELRPNERVTIGRPLPNYHALLLRIFEEDENAQRIEPLEPVPGAEGEIAVGGPCVGSGYVRRPELTAKKFVQHPFRPQETLYRCGDRVRLDDEGRFIFLGRIDTQVKHRGFRIELGEIESQLSSAPDVRAAAVILANTGESDARLEAYVVMSDDVTMDVQGVRKSLTTLPAYMHPEYFQQLAADQMPRLPSGKISAAGLQTLSKARKAAEAAAMEQAGDETLGAELVEYDVGSSIGILLRALASLFPQHKGPISPNSDIFMDLGGHSLIAALLVSKLRKGVEDVPENPFVMMGLQDVYECRTAAALAERFPISNDGSTAGHQGSAVDEKGMPIGKTVDPSGPHTIPHHPSSPLKHALCAIAQLPCLLFLFFLASIDFLVPYLVFGFLTDVRGVGVAIAASYGTFVAIPPGFMLVAVASKWILLGRVQEREEPLWGWFYLRWWFAERICQIVNVKVMADSPVYPLYLRMMGAKVGPGCHLGEMRIGACCDLLEIGPDVVVGSDVIVSVSVVEGGMLKLKKIRIGSDAHVGSSSVLEGGSTIEDGAELASLSMVPTGVTVPSGERWHGSPARFLQDTNLTDTGHSSRPSVGRHIALTLGFQFCTTFVLPLLYFLPQIPGLMLFDKLVVHGVSPYVQVAVIAPCVALGYTALVLIQLLIFKWLVLPGGLKEGTWSTFSFYYLRKWLLDRMMDLSLVILHPVFATLYVVPFLRALGVRIGDRAEVSTARGLQFELTEIGKESFVADAVMLGSAEVRRNEITLMKTKLESRAFAGNFSLLPQGTVLASETLVGVLSVAPPAHTPLKPGMSCFGSPPVMMPSRDKAVTHDEDVLFYPSRKMVVLRLLIEGFRILFPRVVIVYALGFGLQVVITIRNQIGEVKTLLMLPLFYFFLFALPALVLTIFVKWTFVGRYKNAAWPMWSVECWRSEAVTSIYETLLEPLFCTFLQGTPYLCVVLRMLGVTIGKRVWLGHTDVTEYDMVSIGDEAQCNANSGAQTHLFEDRVMKVGPVHVGARSVMRPYSIALPGATISDDSQLGSLSLMMKGETLPPGTAWEGAPVAPRGKHRSPTGGRPAVKFEGYPSGVVVPGSVATLHSSYKDGDQNDITASPRFQSAATSVTNVNIAEGSYPPSVLSTPSTRDQSPATLASVLRFPSVA